MDEVVLPGDVVAIPKEARQNNAFALFCIGVKAILVAETRDFGFLAPNFFGSPRKGAG